MLSRAIVVCFHKYTPYGEEFYEPLLDFFLKQMTKYKDEYDQLYLIDSNWDIANTSELPPGMFAKIIKVNPNLRYYEAYKLVLPQIKEDLVLFMDNDFLVFKKWLLNNAFHVLNIEKRCIHGIGHGICTDCWNNDVKFQRFDVVSIIDTIGTMKVSLEKGNKCCPYFFATRKELLMKYLDVDWGPDSMPYTETFGLLTEAILKDGFHIYELQDNKSSIYFDETQDEPKNTHFYHIRAGSTPAVLLAWKENDPDQYWKYLKEQPKSEYLRQICWYWWMCFMTVNPDRLKDIEDMLYDMQIPEKEWREYRQKFQKYHGLI